MFSTARSRALHDLAWSTDQSDNVEYIEAWKFSTDHSATVHNLRHALLKDSKIEEWLAQEGIYSMPPVPTPDSKLEGGIRLVISESKYFQPTSFSMSKQSYLRIEEVFNLPQVTLHALTNESGIFNRYVEYDEKIPEQVKRVGIVIKASQKYQIGNYGLSISHDFTTHLTTGLLHGTGVILDRNDFSAWPENQSMEVFDLIKAVPLLGAGMILDRNDSSAWPESPSVEIFNLIKAVAHLWTHPMLLPTILLQHHVFCAESFCITQIDDQVNRIQHQLGMSRAGRLNHQGGPYEDLVRERPIRDTKVNLHNLTGELNTWITEMIYFCRMSDWQCECLDFLARVIDEVAGLTGPRADSCMSETREIREYIEYLVSAARGLKRTNNSTRERLQAEFNVLCSLIAQIDNRLTAKMAATSSRDSTAMKTLAFITTLFLPGTFVATIFSTGMFNWQSSLSSDSPPRLVSSNFWIYWAITIPLTFIVTVSWRVWQMWEKRYYDQDVLLEIENIEESASFNLQKEKLGNERQIGTKEDILTRGWHSLRRRSGKQVSTDKEV